MKRFLLAFALLGFVSFAAQGQSCCAKAGKTAGVKSDISCSSSSSNSEAFKAASLDDSIEQRVDNTTGKVSFVRREVDASTGQATYVPVEFSSETKRFVNQAPEMKADCHKEGKTTAACCANGTGACCTKESSSKTSSTSVKLIKSTSGTN